MADPVELNPLPPEEAIAYFRGRGLAEGFAWEDVWQEEHARAFTVAKAMNRDVLEDIRAALDKALAEGTTLDQFRQELTPLLQARGWWGRREMTDPLTGETREVQLGSPRRLRTIFDVNMRSAYQAGRWQRIQRVKAAMPYLRYVATLDGRTRPQHRAWHGVVLPADDPWWNTHYPPCGWRCRCTVTQMSARTLARRGFQVTERPPAFPQRPYVNRRTGEVTTVETGIDPGFSFNVGQAHLDGVTPRPLPDAPDRGGPDRDGSGWPEVNAARDAPARPGALLPADVTFEEASAAFLGVLDAAAGRVMTDVAGERLVVGPALLKRADGQAPRLPQARLRSLNLIALTIAQPDQIRLAWREAEDGRRQLVRRYIAEWATPDGLVETMAEFSGDGWRARSSAEPDFHIIAVLGGLVTWRRPVV